MTIWLLALLLLASLAGLGFRQGAIRVAFSLLGILVGIIVAAPLGKLIRPLLGVFGLKNPIEAWLLAPLIIFGAYQDRGKSDVEVHPFQEAPRVMGFNRPFFGDGDVRPSREAVFQIPL